MYAAFKAALVPVNTNYRYTADELLYLWDNADAGAVVFHGCFADRIDAIRDRLPKMKAWLWVDDGSAVRAPTGPPRTRTLQPAAPAGWPPSGDAPATTSTCSTPAAPPACPRASCGARTILWSA